MFCGTSITTDLGVLGCIFYKVKFVRSVLIFRFLFKGRISVEYQHRKPNLIFETIFQVNKSKSEGRSGNILNFDVVNIGATVEGAVA